MIQRKEVFCDDPLVEMWKHLRLLTDTSAVSEIIVSEHFQGKGDEVEKNRKNILKQAEQVSFCIRQAEEYFDSSNVVGLATKPLLLYYGATSLAMALSLVRKGGEHSLDARRRSPHSNHHGLEIVGDVVSLSRQGVAPAEFFKGVGCKVYLKDDSPTGAFPFYYESLFPDVVSVPFTTTFTDSPFTSSGERTIPCADKMPVEEISKRCFYLSEVLSGIPDLVDDLGSLSLPIILRRCRYTLAFHQPMNIDAVNETDEVIHEVHDLFIYGMSPDDERLLQSFYAGIQNVQRMSFEQVAAGTVHGTTFSETIGSVLRTVKRRFPNLILNQVRQVKYVFQK